MQGSDLLLIILPIFLVLFGVFILNPLHKNNISQPLCQQYTLKQSDQVWFYKPDEICWTKGEVLYLWGYHPVVYCKQLNKTFNFHEIEWTIGND
jgi:hypothetical protein